jgi:hypothetical protein
MVDKQDEQVLASVMGDERAAAARVAAISARRSEMAREALALQQQLARLALAADAVVKEALGDLFLTANQVRVPDNTQAAVSWSEISAVVANAIAAMGEYRRTLAPVTDLAGQVIAQIAPLLAVTESEIEQRADLLVEARTNALAAQAAHYPAQ